MLAEAKKPVRRGTRELIFSAHDAEWQAILTNGKTGELMHLFIHPVLDEHGEYSPRLFGVYSSACSLCQMVNGLLDRHTAAAIADTLTGIFTAANGNGVAVVRREYSEFLPQIVRILRRGET